MPVLTLKIDDLGAQGDGIARHEGKTIFVAGALTHEIVRVQTRTDEKGVLRGKLLEILTPSPDRKEASCPHFPTCGGCRLQLLDDKAYRQFKQNLIENLLSKEGLLPARIEPVFVTPPATRRRARLAARHVKSGVLIGFNEERSPQIVDLSFCAVLHPSLTRFIGILREKLGLWLPQGDACDIHLTALDSGLDVLLIGGPSLDLDAREKLGALAQEQGVARLSWRERDRSPLEILGQNAEPSAQFGETRVSFPAASFLQATEDGEKALISFANKFARQGMKILDLFCGLGTFGLSFERPALVHFAELDGPAIEALAATVKTFPRYATFRRNLFKEPFTATECSAFDLVLFDPPRGGAKTQAVEIAKSSAKRVLAVSCDPASFARDAKILAQGGYTFEELLPVDQFLWSNHLELIASFRK